MINNLAIIGLGGIGSYFIRGLSELIKSGVITSNMLNIYNIDIYDKDIVEQKNLLYQNYDIFDINKYKAEVLAKRFGFNGIVKQIDDINQIDAYDFIVLCVDNNQIRLKIYNSKKIFLDLRANGNIIMAYLTKYKDLDYELLTKDNNISGSCQRKEDIDNNTIQLGNRIIAEVGLQFLLDYLYNNINRKKQILLI